MSEKCTKGGDRGCCCVKCKVDEVNVNLSRIVNLLDRIAEMGVDPMKPTTRSSCEIDLAGEHEWDCPCNPRKAKPIQEKWVKVAQVNQDLSSEVYRIEKKLDALDSKLEYLNGKIAKNWGVLTKILYFLENGKERVV